MAYSLISVTGQGQAKAETRKPVWASRVGGWGSSTWAASVTLRVYITKVLDWKQGQELTSGVPSGSLVQCAGLDSLPQKTDYNSCCVANVYISFFFMLNPTLHSDLLHHILALQLFFFSPKDTVAVVFCCSVLLSADWGWDVTPLHQLKCESCLSSHKHSVRHMVNSQKGVVSLTHVSQMYHKYQWCGLLSF